MTAVSVALLFAASASAQSGTANKPDADAASSTKQTKQDPAASDGQRIQALISRLSLKAKRVRSHQAVFHRREFRDGAVGVKEKVYLRHHSKSGAVYMKWLDGPNEGRGLLYTPRTNTVAVTAPLMTVHLEPDSWLIRKSSRHPISDVGVRKLSAIIGRDAKLAQEREYRGVEYRMLRPQTHFNRKTTCFESRTPKHVEPRFYAVRSVVCVDDELGLPIFVKVWDQEDGQLRMIEEIGYENLRLNPPLPPDAFREDHSAYGF